MLIRHFFLVAVILVVYVGLGTLVVVHPVAVFFRLPISFWVKNGLKLLKGEEPPKKCGAHLYRRTRLPLTPLKPPNLSLY